MVFDACGPRETGSSETPSRLDSVVLLRKPCQHVGVPGQSPEPSSSLRYSGASSRSRL